MLEFDYIIYFSLTGLLIGFVYSLVALGVTIIYGIINIPDFSHGNRYMLSAYAGFLSATAFNGGLAGYLFAIIVAACVGALIAMMSYVLVYRRIESGPHITAFIAALGILMILEGVARATFGTQYYIIQSPYDFTIALSSLRIEAHKLVVLSASIIAICLLLIFLEKTTTGIALGATAQSPLGAKLVGINTNNMTLLAFGISGALAGYAATLIAPITMIYPTMGAELNLKAFVICVVGGLGNIPGTFLSGLILGLTESLFGAFIDMKWKNLVAFVILVLILCIKPEGIFTKRGRKA